ncbi:6-bladed beta-propeller [Fontivita pretiosa]|uniref:6-bladed beta-propeller n=1 Tax=Fontivita pretiosa TaxID=2989684 RepID=UPI003D186B10
MRAAQRIRCLFSAIGWLALLVAGTWMVGCAKPAGVIFPPPQKPIVWPGPPEPPRIRYVGQIATSADLKPAVPLTRRLSEAIFGKRPIRSMLTPYAVCTDGKHRLFVADSNAQLVHVFDLATRQYAQWKPSERYEPFSQPVGLAWDSTTSQLYVADSIGGRIYVFDGSGKTVGQIGGQFLSRPCGLAIDPPRDRLYVADAELHQLVVLSRDGRLVSRFGHRGTGPAEFNFPTNVALDRAGRIYVSDSLNFRVLQFDPDLRPLRQIGRKGDLPGYFGQPKGIATDSENHLYVVDAHFEAVQIFDADGNLLLDFGQEGTGPGEFWLPAGIHIDPNNRIWIADSYNRRVQVFDYLPEARP